MAAAIQAAHLRTALSARRAVPSVRWCAVSANASDPAEMRGAYPGRLLACIERMHWREGAAAVRRTFGAGLRELQRELQPARKGAA